MKFESYIKILFDKYLWKKINFKEYDSVFEKYNELIIKNNNEYLSIGNEFNINLFSREDIDILKNNFNINSMIIDSRINNIFNHYLSKIISGNNEYDRYYFKIQDGDINPDNIVDSGTLVFIIKMKIDYEMDFEIFLKKQSELKKECKKIENEIREKNNIKIKILFDINYS